MLRNKHQQRKFTTFWTPDIVERYSQIPRSTLEEQQELNYRNEKITLKYRLMLEKMN